MENECNDFIKFHSEKFVVQIQNVCSHNSVNKLHAISYGSRMTYKNEARLKEHRAICDV